MRRVNIKHFENKICLKYLSEIVKPIGKYVMKIYSDVYFLNFRICVYYNEYFSLRICYSAFKLNYTESSSKHIFKKTYF